MEETHINSLRSEGSNPSKAFTNLLEEIKKYKVQNPTHKILNTPYSIIENPGGHKNDAYECSAIILYEKTKVAHKDDTDGD